jgi:hypothetical protein
MQERRNNPPHVGAIHMPFFYLPVIVWELTSNTGWWGGVDDRFVKNPDTHRRAREASFADNSPIYKHLSGITSQKPKSIIVKFSDK